MSYQEPDELEQSLKSPIGQIEDITCCMQHTDRILSGRHRFKYLNKIGKFARSRMIDCEAIAKRENISHEMAHWLITRAANIRRVVPEDEQRSDLVQMAVILEADGMPPEKRVKEIAHLTGLSERRIQELLPKDHKREYDKSATVAQLEPESEKQRFSETASVHRVSSYTQAEQLFSGHLSYFNVKYKTQEPFIRPGEFSNGGIQKTFVADFYLPDKNIVIELEGSGSASADNGHRDDYFKDRGMRVVHLPNEAATKFGAHIAELIAVLLK